MRVEPLRCARRPRDNAADGSCNGMVRQLEANRRPCVSWNRTAGPASAGAELEALRQLEPNWRPCVSWKQTGGPASAGTELEPSRSSCCQPLRVLARALIACDGLLDCMQAACSRPIAAHPSSARHAAVPQTCAAAFHRGRSSSRGPGVRSLLGEGLGLGSQTIGSHRPVHTIC